MIEEWCLFCKGEKEFELSYFYTLFWEDITESDLEIICSFFPFSNVLKQNIFNYLHRGSHPKSNEKNVKEIILNYAYLDFQEKKRICEIIKNSELIDYLSVTKIRFEFDFEEFERQVKLNDSFIFEDLSAELTFYFSDKKISFEKKYYALFEALYGLTKDNEIVRYLAKPLLNTSYNSYFYYNFSWLGGVYYLFKDEVVVSMNPLFIE